MPTTRSSSWRRSRRWLRRATLASSMGPRRLIREILARKSAATARALIVAAAVSLFLTACGHQPNLVMDDFESGALTGWRTVGGGSGGWFIYSNGSKAPDPARSDPSVPFDLPDPPQGRFAAVTDVNGPGTRILYRDLRLEGRFSLQLSVFYTGTGPFSSPATLAYDTPEANQQFRIDLLRPSAPIDSVVKGDVLVNVFRTSPGDPPRRQPTEARVDVSAWAGQTVRLRPGRDRQSRAAAGRGGQHPVPADRGCRRSGGAAGHPQAIERGGSGTAPAAPSGGAGGAR